jgi:hypothetical protein
MVSKAEITPPTYEEFVVAREQAKFDGEQGEDAYQVCRWFRGQMLLRERADRWLNAHRNSR